jgi:myo-inositol-1(or 4)-monophosphatase
MPELSHSGDAAGALGPSAQHWFDACRRAVEVQKGVFADHIGIGARTQYEGVGEGGDNTLVIDRMCEDAVFTELERLHADGHDFTAIAEERGEVAFGDGSSPVRVVIDPIDGSLNARRTVPYHCLSVAVADGNTMEDVKLAYIYEFGASEEFTAVAGEGARLDGREIQTGDHDELEVVAVEASKPERVMAVCEVLDGRAYRIRSPGAIAVDLAYVASARFDALLTTRPCRSVDAAAGQLIVREAGGHVGFDGGGPADAKLGLDARFHCSAARTAGDLAVAREAQEAVG